ILLRSVADYLRVIRFGVTNQQNPMPLSAVRSFFLTLLRFASELRPVRKKSLALRAMGFC
ncbi:MAG TPA: hypothetical protein P5190_10810, partial [Bacteroidales bacterium]|nr:hypothetical protein [Bacteroidales bacterium]